MSGLRPASSRREGSSVRAFGLAWRWCVAVVALVCVLAPPAVAATDTGSISGTITSGGQPLAGAYVYVVGGPQRYRYDSPVTDASGRYVVEGLPAGSYTVQLYGPDVPGSTGYGAQLYGHSAATPSGTPVAVAAGAATPGIDAALPVGGGIAGHVSEDDQTPCWLKVYATPVGGGVESVVYPGCSREYSIPGLAPGSYKVTFVDPVYGSTRAYDQVSVGGPFTPVAVVSGTFHGDIDGILFPGYGNTSITVTDDLGAPVAGARVTAHVMSTDFISTMRTAATDEDGRYEIHDMPEAMYSISAMYPSSNAGGVLRPGLFQADGNGTASGIDLVLPRSTTLGGYVTVPGGGSPAGLVVQATPADGVNPGYAQAVVDAFGGYWFRGLLPGRYRVQFLNASGGASVPGLYREVYWPDSVAPAGAEIVTLVAGQTRAGVDHAYTSADGRTPTPTRSPAATPTPTTTEAPARDVAAVPTPTPAAQSPQSAVVAGIAPGGSPTIGPATPSPTPKPVVSPRLDTTRSLVAAHGAIVLSFTCPAGGSCSAAAVLTARIKKHKGTVTIVLGRANVVGAGPATIELTPAGKRLVKSKHGKLTAQLTLTPSGGAAVSRSVTIGRSKAKAAGGH